MGDGFFGCFGVFGVIGVIDVFSVVVSLLDGVNDDSGEGEGDEHHDPACKVFAQVGSRDGIHTEGTGGTGRLNGLVETGETGEGERVVG